MSLLLDTSVGALVGAAVGDALGGATETALPEQIRARFGGWVEGIVPPFHADWATARPLAPYHKGDGHITDDTLMTHALVRAYAAKRDHLDAYDVADLLVPDLIERVVRIPDLERDGVTFLRLAAAERWLVTRLHHAHADPREAGVGNIVNCGAAMYMAPVGIVNAGDPAGAYAEAVEIAGAHQHSYGREAAAVFAAAVAAAATPGARVDDVVTAGARRGPGRHPRCDRRGGQGGRGDTRTGARRSPRCGPRSRPSTPSARTTAARVWAPAARAGCTRSRSCRSPSACWSWPAASSARRCSARSTTAGTPTRPPPWPARSPARSAARPRSRRTGPTAVATASQTDLEAPARELAAVATEVFERDREPVRPARPSGSPALAGAPAL